MHLAHSEAMLFKFGSGTGTDLSPIRSSKEKLSGGGRPSGPLSFLKVYDQVANVVKSGGKTRRAAKMNTLRDWHGDIEEFIDAKQKEEKKAWALIEQGYDGSYNGDAYGSVMYQNENLSVRVSDEFMQAAARRQGMVDARRHHRQAAARRRTPATLLHKIAEGTWICGDPGHAVRRRHPEMAHLQGHRADSLDQSRAREYVFLNNTACNLASLNLMKFKREDGTFDVERFKAAVRIFITAQEILVDNASYPTKEIAENSHIFRTLGLGYANLGSLIMSYGLPYDSDEGRALAGAITAIMTGHAYEQSAEIAARHGPVPGLSRRPLRARQQAASARTTSSPCSASSSSIATRSRKSSRARSSITSRTRPASAGTARWRAAGQAGYRNAQVTVLAPTGTIAFLMDCDTTGIEPDIALVKYKLLAGGGMLKIVNRTVPDGLRRLGYSAEEVERIIAHIEKYDTIEDVEEDGARRRERPEARASAGVRLRLQALPRQAQHPLPGAPQDDGRRAAVHQRRDLQDRQHAQRQHRRGHPRRLRAGLEDGPQVRRHLPRRLEALPAAQHQDARTKAAPRRPRGDRASARSAASRNSRPRSPRLRDAGRQAAAPPPARHPHRHHPQVRHRRPRRLPHRRPVRGRPARRAVHHDGQGRLDHRRPDGQHRHARPAWRCNTACRWRRWSGSSPTSASSPPASPRTPTSATPPPSPTTSSAGWPCSSSPATAKPTRPTATSRNWPCPVCWRK